MMGTASFCAMWYLNINNSQEGPFDEQAVAAHAASGRINPNTLGWRQGMPEWLPLHRTELARLFSAASAPGHGMPPPPPGYPQGYYGGGGGGQGFDKAKKAGADAWEAFKLLASDPVGKLKESHDALGPNRALIVGIIFGAVCVICAFLGMYVFLSRVSRFSVDSIGIGEFVKAFFFAFVPYVSLVGASLAARKIFRGEGGLSHDCYLAGVALLPLGLIMLIGSLLGQANVEVVGVLTLLAFCLFILVLFAGMNRLSKLSERAATLAVPLMIIASAWFSKIIFATFFSPKM